MNKTDWIPVVGYESDYEINSNGDVRCSHSRTLGKRVYKEKHSLLSVSISDGYKVCSLKKGKKSKMFKVHRLIALHFIPNPEQKPCVNHIDNNRTNNNISNLEWCTPQENNQHMFSQFRHRHGENHYESKLKDADIFFIRNYVSENPLVDLAKIFKVTKHHIDNIRHYRKWKHLP